MKKMASNTIIFILFLYGIIRLQIFLSKKDKKWYGLTLPILFFSLNSLAVIINVAILDDFKTSILQLVLTLLFVNIFPLILFIIHLACRDKINKNKELDKMKINDL